MMWKNYLVSAARSMARARVAAGIEVVGLGLALSAVLLIAAYVQHEFSYEKWIPGHQRVYTVETTIRLGPDRSNTVLAAPDFLKALLIDGANGIETAGRLGRMQQQLIKDGAKTGVFLHQADQELLDILAPEVLEGRLEGALSRPDAVVLTRDAADRIFGPGATALGESVESGDGTLRRVSAVIADLPAATHIKFDALAPFPQASASVAQGGLQQMFMISNALYVRLEPDTSPSDMQAVLESNLQRHFEQRLSAAAALLQQMPISFKLIPLADIHFGRSNPIGKGNTGSVGMVLAVGGVGLAILIVAMVNYAGLSLARAISRSREIALRQTLGAERTQLGLQFLLEALSTGLVALLIGFSLAELLLPTFAGLVERPLTPENLHRPDFIAVALAIGLAVGMAGGVYPALIAGRSRPSILMQARNRSGRPGWIGRALLVVQYAITVGLIAGVLVFSSQMRLAGERMAQFDAANVQIIRQQPGFGYSQMKLLEQQLAGRPGIEGIAYGMTAPGARNVINRQYQSPELDTPVSLESYTVSPGYFELLGVAPVAGRSFGSARKAVDGGPATASSRWAILNETALKQLGFGDPEEAVGETLQSIGPSRLSAGAPSDESFEIIGVIPDLNYDSIREPVRATVFVSGNADFVESSLGSLPNVPNFTLMLLRFDPGNMQAGLASLKAARETVFPDGALNGVFLDQHLLALYESDLRRRELLTWAAGLAILLAAMGLYAKAGQAAALRTREVAMRKVSGAQVVDILRLQLWQFAKPVLLANLLAWPVAGWFMLRWLEGFATRIELTPWPFLLAGAAALAIALLTVTGHAYRVARTHPALALREE